MFEMTFGLANREMCGVCVYVERRISWKYGELYFMESKEKKNKHEIPPTTAHTFLLNASNQFLDLDSRREYNTACCRQKVTC